MLTLPTYVTRERLADSLDAKASLLDLSLLDDAAAYGSASVETRCRHRSFYPLVETRYFDWPSLDGSAGYRLWLGSSEIISLTSLTSAGDTVSSAAILLEPSIDGPPYNRVDLDVSTSAAFSAGDTYQRNIAITGTWAGAPLRTETLGVTVEALDDTETGVDVDGPTAAGAGVGDLLVIGSERMLVVDRSWLATADTATLTASMAAGSLPVASGATYRRGERLLIESERVQVLDIAGNTLSVKRAVDGTTLAAHTSATVYAGRTFTVVRGFGGTTAAAAGSGAAVSVHRYPSEVAELALAEAVVFYQQRSGGFSTTVRSEGASGKAPTGTLDDVRAKCEAAWRRYRQGAV